MLVLEMIVLVWPCVSKNNCQNKIRNSNGPHECASFVCYYTSSYEAKQRSLDYKTRETSIS
jgi:hypothetical protein